MKNVCVITGGANGMGFATAKNIPTNKILIIADINGDKIADAIIELEGLGYEVYGKTCDITNREEIKELAEYAASFGEIKNVINTAGLSPSMANPEKLFRVNALGTIYINEEFSKLMNKGSVIVNTASNAAYNLPKIVVNKRTFALADKNEDLFLKKSLKLPNMLKGYPSSGLAYALSKEFVIWYAKKCAYEYGEKGIRVCSISPGIVSTNMGNLEANQGDGNSLLKSTAEKRMGNPEELGFAIATIADERNGYLAGVDVLIDGGSYYCKNFAKHSKK